MSVQLNLPFLKKLEKREDEMAVQVSCDARREVVILVLRHGFAEFDVAEKAARIGFSGSGVGTGLF